MIILSNGGDVFHLAFTRGELELILDAVCRARGLNRPYLGQRDWERLGVLQGEFESLTEVPAP